ncbi:jg23472 [Pararge aegeria aegeria]|uniref:Jg23472 protein n=1 Tax=Pararge aegeria aegeria TaxID=348720 RepID=A0A8S4S177_9NEOP|nr:jg23472 [Pararge aegeria aegeria]
MESTTNQKVSCIVNYSYDASETDELTIRPGEILREVERLPGGWWKGELRGRRGMFPDNFVSVLTEQNNARPGGAQGRCRAVFSYQPANPDELPLCVGDVLEVLGEVEEGWWQGRRGVRVGVFPSNFVVMLEPPPAQPAPCEPAPALPPKPGIIYIIIYLFTYPERRNSFPWHLRYGNAPVPNIAYLVTISSVLFSFVVEPNIVILMKFGTYIAYILEMDIGYFISGKQ